MSNVRRSKTFETKRRREESLDRVTDKLHALVWVLGDALLLYATDFVRVCTEDERVNRPAFNVGVVGVGVFAFLMVYATLWVPYVKRITLDIQIYSPRLIPVATAFGVLASLSFMIGLWPIYGLFTPFILGANFFSFIMLAHFLPPI